MASAFGSILFCSGRDEAADDLIQENNADVIDALDERFGGSGFWRDVERVNTYGYTHSMSVSANAVASLPTLYGFAAPSAPVPDFLNFTDGGQPASWASANHVVITYSEVQRVQLIYDLKTQNYVRFQFGAKPHVDGEDASSLAFRNIILLIASPAEKSETALRLTGTGSGIYITSGKSSPITWTRESEADAFRFAFNNGKTPVFNSGKTLICVIPSSVSDAGGIMTDYNQKRDGALK